MISKLFDNIGRAFTSLGAVIFVMTMIIVAMIFFSHTLFLQVFPDTMQLWEKKVATWSMALSWELTVLITTCNVRHVGKRIPLLMALASGVIVLFFIEAFDNSLTGLEITQRWLVGLLAAGINYIYADLFYSKWQERGIMNALPAQLQERERELEQVRAFLQKSDERLMELASTLANREATLLELRAEVKEVRSKLEQHETEFKCEWCGNVQRSESSLRSHKGHCDKNPKRKLMEV